MTSPDGRGAVPVLLVEDNPGDVRLVREGLEGGYRRVALHVVGTGDEALLYLRSQPPDDPARPALVLLDLNLPDQDGREVLAAIKSDLALRAIPVCVLSSSADPADIDLAYQAHANAYVTKPMELDQFLVAVRQLERFWVSAASPPAPRRPGPIS